MLTPVLAALACLAASSPTRSTEAARGVLAAPDRAIISVVATSDLHGALLEENGRGGLEVFAGYLANLRAARERDGGAVVLVDAGDLFQGTLESNLAEGAPVIAAYNALGYAAATIGNHEFDYGPLGPATVPTHPADDPFGALRARIAEARFPFLAANLRYRDGGPALDWDNTRPVELIERAGIRIGIVGATGERTLHMTMAENVRRLEVAPVADTLRREADRLRQRGAALVVALVHAGGRCRALHTPGDLSSCDRDAEIMRIAAALAPGEIDLIAAGHTHQAMAHLVHGTPVVEAWSSGRGFSRVDFTFERATGKRLDHRIHPPRAICARVHRGSESCDGEPGRRGAWVRARYEGRAIEPDPALQALLAPARERAQTLARRPLGAVARARITRSFEAESALGNLIADLMLAARPDARAAIVNAGGLRADLPAGPVEYGDLYRIYPFDNRFALLRLTGRELERLLARHLAGTGGAWSLAGLRAEARCRDGRLEVETGLGDDEEVVVATSDFLATSSEVTGRRAVAVRIEHGTRIREELARVLEARGGDLDPKRLLDPDRPRLRWPGQRPVHCARE